MDYSILTDSQLYTKAKEFGENARKWRRKFAGLLPEVEKRRLYKRRGFGSIYEFAFKLCGMSQRSVDKVLHLAEKLADLPHLLHLLTNGEQSWGKLQIVASSATIENEQDLAKKVQSMTFSALRTYISLTNQPDDSYMTGTGHAQNELDWSQVSFKVKRKTDYRLREIKRDLEKETKETMSFNEVLEHLFEKKASPPVQTIIKVCPECAKRKGLLAKTRAIPQEVKKLIHAKYKGHCVFKGCKLPATSLHHTKRYTLENNHDPDFIVPLCKTHERFVHSGLIENEDDPPENWKILNKPAKNHPKYAIDKQVQIHRTAA